MDRRQQLIRSPEYPNKYPNVADCVWNIYTIHNITLHFEQFKTEEGSDGITISDDDGHIITEISGGNTPDDMQLQTHIVLRFRSDSTITDNGFLIRYDFKGKYQNI